MYKIKDYYNSKIYIDTVEGEEIIFPKKYIYKLISIKEPDILEYPNDYIKSLNSPINSEFLSTIAKDKKTVAIIVSDHTRNVPTSYIMPFVIQNLKEGGILEENISIIIATGVHRKSSKEEIIKIIGQEAYGRVKIFNHDPFNQEELINLDQTSFGTPIEINKIAYSCDIRITIGKVEPHEFAGFSGGRKSILPGISSEKAIEKNHSTKMILNKYSIPGELEMNPISQDMTEYAKRIGVNFNINFVLNSKEEVIGLFCGELVESHKRAVDFSESIYTVNLDSSPDIIITTPGSPLNIDFYQSIKPLFALMPMLKENTVVVLYADCPEGLNSEDMLKPFIKSDNIDRVLEEIEQDYKIQMDHSLLLCRTLKKGIKVIVYSPNMNKETLEKMFLYSSNTLQGALDEAIKIIGKEDPELLFYPQPQRTLPNLIK